MKEKDIIFRTKAALTFAARGGMKASLFTDTVQEDRHMLVESGVLTVPISQFTVVERAISEWRSDHEWMRHIPDNIEGEGLK